MTTEHSRHRIIGSSKRSKSAKKVTSAKVALNSKSNKSDNSAEKIIFKKDKTKQTTHSLTWILFFCAIALLIAIAWFFRQYLLPNSTSTLVQTELTTIPTVFDAGQYYKFEVPREEWQSLDETATIQQLVNSGLRFDEAWFQEGGWVCQVCGSYASPLIYFKNPSATSGAGWQKIDKPGFYSNQSFKIFQYLLN